MYDPETLAALSAADRVLVGKALELAIGNRERYLPRDPTVSNADIALGLLLRALAHGITRYCTSHENVMDVTARMQSHLLDHVNAQMADGRPLGGVLHS